MTAAPSTPVVCHVTSVHQPFDSRVFYHECRSLASRYRTVLVCRDDGGDREVDGVSIRALPKTRGRVARYFGTRELVALAESTGASLFHFHDPELLVPMSRLARRTGLPVIYDAHEHYPDAMDQKTWIPAPLRPLAASWADSTERSTARDFAAIVVADAALAKRFGAMHHKVLEIDNYPPLRVLGPALEPRDGVPTMAYVGSVSMVRGFSEMVGVLERVRREVPDARLVVYGRPTEEVAPQIADVERRLPGAIEFRGPVRYGELAHALADAHVGLSLLRPHPKYEKNVSMKVFDYMALGLPYVASDFAPLREATRGEGGLLVKPGDVEQAAEAVTEILTDRERAASLGREGRSAIETRLNWELVEPRLFDLYEELLSR